METPQSYSQSKYYIFRGVFVHASVNQIKKEEKRKTRHRPAEPITGPIEPICRAAAHHSQCAARSAVARRGPPPRPPELAMAGSAGAAARRGRIRHGRRRPSSPWPPPPQLAMPGSAMAAARRCLIRAPSSAACRGPAVAPPPVRGHAPRRHPTRSAITRCR